MVSLAQHHARPLWRLVRASLVVPLGIIAPVVSFTLGLMALLGVLTALFWKFLGPPEFPFALILGMSVGFQLARILFDRFLRFLDA